MYKETMFIYNQKSLFLYFHYGIITNTVLRTHEALFRSNVLEPRVSPVETSSFTRWN